MRLVLTIAAILCFLLAAFGRDTIGVVGLVPLGLALFAGSFIFEGITLNRAG